MFGLKKLFGDDNAKALKAYEGNVGKINSLESEFKLLSDEALRAKTDEFKKRLAKNENAKALDLLLPEAFAAVREASVRTLGQRHFDVQLIGGMILHGGNISEMRTGEGKTLVATLPVYLNALEGKGVHVVTVNDYLSRRDAVWMGQIYHFLGLTVGCINHDTSYLYDPTHGNGNPKSEIRNPKQIQNSNDQNSRDELDKKRDEQGSFKVVHEFLKSCTRTEAYAADITYGTNNEFGFDYLRDNIEYEAQNLRQRGYNYAIIDEIDSILIDEARTPLIISAPAQESEGFYEIFAKISEKINEGEDYTVDEKFKAITLTDKGIQKTEKILGIDNIYTEKGIKYVHHLETAIRAKALFKRDKDYVTRDNQIIIVDEFTGRLQPGRRWSEGLHQAIEAKEGVKIERESRTFASITFQNYFRLYKKLSGMTGTAITSKEEFYKVYGLDTLAVATNVPILRNDKNDLIFQTETGKFKAVATKVKELNEKGQPVLIGTVSIEKNELLSAFLKTNGVQHEILNAKNHEREGEIIAQAGRKAAVTIATNMAGRGVDIKLGGVNAANEDYQEVKKIGGLFVLGTERHEARRIDNQLRGRSGRQGDPGETQFFVSMEDSLMRVFAADTIKKMMGRLGIPEDEPIENRIITRSLESAQTKIEGFNFDSRSHVLEYDNVLNIQRRSVYQRRRNILLGNHEVIDQELHDLVADNKKLIDIISEKKKTLGMEEFYSTVRKLLLQTIDMFWVEHLELMDYTRSSVRLRAYGQRDPLIEYKKEGLRLFREMQEATNAQILSVLPNIGVGAFEKGIQEMKETQKKMQMISASSQGSASQTSSTAASPNREKVGRNDPCPCGSGKKYKRCHGK